MFRSGKTKVVKKEFNCAKQTVKMWDFNVDNIVIVIIVIF